jgi:predicted nucleotidyltransferase
MATFNLDEHRRALEAYFASLDNLVLAYLFGSHARDQAGPLSDVDVAVLLAGRPDDGHCFDMRLEIIGGLMDILHINAVDVAILNQVPLALRYRVLRDGRLLYCRDRQAMIEFYARTVTEYLDFKPVIERHERAILERARKGELLHGYNPHRGALERYRRLRERLEGAARSDV